MSLKTVTICRTLHTHDMLLLQRRHYANEVSHSRLQPRSCITLDYYYLSGLQAHKSQTLRQKGGPRLTFKMRTRPEMAKSYQQSLYMIKLDVPVTKKRGNCLSTARS